MFEQPEHGNGRRPAQLPCHSPHLPPEIDATQGPGMLTEGDNVGDRPTQAPASWGQPASDLAAPSFIGGYEILHKIGQGGMGVVYKARHIALNRLVALKLHVLGGDAGLAQLSRFRTEADILARLKHENIVQIYDAGVHEGMPYLAMELIEGGSLAQSLMDDAPSPTQAARCLFKMACAVQSAHERGIVHRDLKPGNVLLAIPTDGSDDRLQHPKVTDFGIAKLLDTSAGLTLTGAVVGTPAYMPPEQAAGRKDVGTAADIYALGAIFYEMLTGQRPFVGATSLIVLQKVQTVEPVAPARLKGQVPKDLSVICMKCLEKSPVRRYASAADLADDLGRFLRGEPIHARPVTLADSTIKWVRRRPALAAAYGLLVFALVLGGLGGGAIWLWRQAVNAREELAAAKARGDELFYLRQVGLAHRDWEEGGVARAERLLESCALERRDWEWRYVYRLCHSDLITLRGYSACYSPDGARLFTTSDNGTVRVWDAVRCREILSWTTGNAASPHLAVSPDGACMAIPSEETVSLWDTKTGKQIGSLAGHTGRVSRVAFSPDGRHMASAAEDYTARIWDVRTAKEVFRLRNHFKGVEGVAFSPDGQRLASTSVFKLAEGEIKLWDTRTGKEVRCLRSPAGILAVAFSPKGRYLAGCSPTDQSVRLWDFASGQEVRTLWGHTDQVSAVAFSPDGKRLASCGIDGMIKVWEVATGRELFSLRGHLGPVTTVAFIPDGQRLASGSVDGTVKLWDANGNQPALALRGHTDEIGGLSYEKTGRRVASAGGDGTVRVWDAATRQQLRCIPAHDRGANCVAFTPDGERLVTGGQRGPVKVWAVSTGALLRVLSGSAVQTGSLAISPDGRLLATTEVSWDRKKGRFVAGAIRVRGLQTDEELRTWRTQSATGLCVAFSPDGSRLAYGGDGCVTVCEVATGQMIFSVAGHDDLVSGVAFSPDGKRLASASWDRTVKVWDVPAGRELLTLHGHTARVIDVAFSPDGHRIASASDDHTVRLFNATSGDEVLSLWGGVGPVHCLAFSPDGQRLASAGWDGILRIWDARPVEGGSGASAQTLDPR